MVTYLNDNRYSKCKICIIFPRFFRIWFGSKCDTMDEKYVEMKVEIRMDYRIDYKLICLPKG